MKTLNQVKQEIREEAVAWVLDDMPRDNIIDMIDTMLFDENLEGNAEEIWDDMEAEVNCEADIESEKAYDWYIAREEALTGAY